jgi:hypothetical protein
MVSKVDPNGVIYVMLIVMSGNKSVEIRRIYKINLPQVDRCWLHIKGIEN